MSDPFDLEEDPAEAAPPRTPLRAAPAAPPRLELGEGAPLDGVPDTLLDDRRKGRLVRFVPGMAGVFALVGWLFMGLSTVLPFLAAGAAVGVFAAWRTRGEILLGCVTAGAGIVTALVSSGFVPGIGAALSMACCGSAGFLLGLDERLRGS